MGQSHWFEMVPQVVWSHAMEGSIGDSGYSELDPEENWRPMQFV